MTHSFMNTGDHDYPSLPNQPFFSWLRKNTALFIPQIVGLLSVVSFLAALIYYSKHASEALNLTPETVVRAIGDLVVYIHLPFLVVFIAALIHLLNNNSQGRYRAKLVYEKLKGKCNEHSSLEDYSERQVKRFKRCFLGFWYSMLFLYVVFAIKSVAESDTAIFTSWRVILSFPFLTFALNNVSLFFIFCCFVVLHLPAKLTIQPSLGKLDRRQRNLTVGFLVSITILTFLFPALATFNKLELNTNELREYSAIFNAVSGTVNAVVLALLIARLDSKLIGLPSWLICMLYFYAGVQPLFLVFELKPSVYAGIKTAVLIIVFIFKIYFFLIIVFSLQTGRMFNYFFCSKILNDHVRRMKESRGRAKKMELQWLARIAPARRAFELLRDRLFEDWRLLLSSILGGLAIAYFVGSLAAYEMRFKGLNLVIASDTFGRLIMFLHLLFLFPLIAVLFNSWRKKRNEMRASEEGSRDRDPQKESSTFKRLSEVRFSKLSDREAKLEWGVEFKELSGPIERRLQSLRGRLLLFWTSLFLLYAVLLLSTYRAPKFYSPQDDSRPAKEVSTPLWTLRAHIGIEITAGVPLADINRGPTVGHENSELVTNGATALGDAAKKESHEYRYSAAEMLLKVKYPIFLYILNNACVLFVFLCFAIMYIPGDSRTLVEKQNLLREYSLLAFLFLSLLIPVLVILLKHNGFTTGDVGQFPAILATVGGTLNAVAFAMLIARLDSRIIGLPSTLIAVLYGYAALQPLFVAVNQPSTTLRVIASSAMVAVFVFEVCLVLILSHIKHSGAVNDYLWFFPVLNNRINSVFDNQFEIRAYMNRPGSFSFSIFNKNVEVYKGSKFYPSRVQCDHAVATLRKRMQERMSYGEKPKELQGTYWVEVSSGGDLICESTSLRSESEARDLINDSIEKVPFCKYSRG